MPKRAAPREVGRLVKVALADVPVELRRKAGQRLLEDAALDARLHEAVALTRAIEQPEGVYWLPEQAVRARLG